MQDDILTREIGLPEQVTVTSEHAIAASQPVIAGLLADLAAERAKFAAAVETCREFQAQVAALRAQVAALNLKAVEPGEV